MFQTSAYSVFVQCDAALTLNAENLCNKVKLHLNSRLAQRPGIFDIKNKSKIFIDFSTPLFRKQKNKGKYTVKHLILEKNFQFIFNLEKYEVERE